MLQSLVTILLLALAPGLLAAPCLAQEVQLEFGIQGTTLRSLYEPGIEPLEREVRDALITHCATDPYLRYWSMVAPAGDAAEPTTRPVMNVVMLLQDDVLRVQLDVRSAFLSGLSGLTTRFSARLAPPADLERITTRGAPPANRLAELVVTSFEGLLANNLAAVFASMSQGCPLGRFGQELTPTVNEAGQQFELVLPIDATDERNCFLRTSLFELLCESSRSTDTRLDSRGTGFTAEFPGDVSAGVPILGVTVALEKLRIGTGEPEPLAPDRDAELMQSVRPRFFFLLELNDRAHTCFSDEVSIVQ